MSFGCLRSTVRVTYLVVLAVLLCLMLPRALSATEGALGSTDGAAVGAAQAPSIKDIGDSAYKSEIEVAVKLGYMSLVDGSSFKPDGKIRAKDFLSCIRKGMSAVGVTSDSESTVENPKAWITRQEAMKMLVSCLLTREQLDLLGKQCGGTSLYLSDFTDANDVASWAESYVAAAVFRGWVPDRARLYPKEDATRGFAAALLARAFPDQTAFTGLVVYVCAPNFKRAMCVQVISEDQTVYPAQDGLPSIAFSSAPGIASFCPSLEEAKKRRVGFNPLVVAAERVQRGRKGEVQLIVPADEAQKIVAANQQGLFLKTWRVAIIEVPSTGVQPTMVSSTSGTPE
jgi:hypothetical protein